MKLTLDERVKHRLVGIAVILSIFAIFLPAALKKNNQPFDALSRIAVRIPAKPEITEVKMPDEQAMFNKVKTTTVKVAALPAEKKSANVKPISIAKEEEPVKTVEIEVAKLGSLPQPKPQNPPKSKTRLQTSLPIIQNMKPAKVNALVAKEQKVSKIIPKRQVGYAVQVASFTNIQNATALMTKLKSRGYNVNFKTVKQPQGTFNYKVIVGKSKSLEEVHLLQKELANQMQLKGFVITG